jgi:hypothetical protein
VHLAPALQGRGACWPRLEEDVWAAEGVDREGERDRRHDPPAARPVYSPGLRKRLAKRTGVSPTTVLRLWRKRGLQPQRVERFKFSTDPAFAPMMTDVVGLYMDPPETALVLCIDEKSPDSGAQSHPAPAATASLGFPARMTHDTGAMAPPRCSPPWRSQPARSMAAASTATATRSSSPSLNSVTRRYPRREIHVIWDNHGTHKHPKVKEWLAAHPPFPHALHPNQLFVAQPG